MADGDTPDTSGKAERDAIAGVLIGWLCDHGYSFRDSNRYVFVSTSELRESLVKIRSDNPAADRRSREGRRWDSAVEVMFRVVARYEREALDGGNGDG